MPLSQTNAIRTFILLPFLFLTQSIKSFAGVVRCGDDCNPPLGGRMAANLSQSKTLQTFNVSALNLKNSPQPSAARMASAINISLADFNTISAVGNSWLLYQANGASFSMNIGTANSSSAQTWTLPANLMTYFQGAGRSDFIAPNSIPQALQVGVGIANKVMRTFYLDNNGTPMQVYDHYDVNSSGINHLGKSYDLEVGDDDTFDEPDYEFSDVPLDLGDNFVSTIEEKEYTTNLTLTKYVQTINTDAYGTISTPDGTFDCLRMSIENKKYTRPNETASYTLVSTTNQVSFMTNEGAYFNAQVSAMSGTATLSNFQYRKVVLTSSLSETSDVKFNNDSKGVTINNDNSTAHPSAILDIKNDSLGVLIPRIAKVNRPSSPATGLLVYQIDDSPGFYYYNGSAWKSLLNNGSTLVGGTQVVGTGGLTASSTNPGSGSSDWIAVNAGGSGGDRVVAGNLFGNATIGGHNSALNAWKDLTINQGGGNVIIGGQSLTPQSGHTTAIRPRPLVVNGSIRQTYYVHGINLAANSTTSVTWTHNFGYAPVVMMSTSQTGSSQNMEYCTYTSYSQDPNVTVFVIRNTGSQTATGNFNWVLVF